MSDQDNNSGDVEQEARDMEPGLFDPWERRFKFERRSRLHSHIVEHDSHSDHDTLR